MSSYARSQGCNRECEREATSGNQALRMRKLGNLMETQKEQI